MPDKPPSPEAMRAVKLMIEDTGTNRSPVYYALIIDREMEPKWVKCSERMPTEEDGDERGEVLWFSPKAKETAHWGAWDNDAGTVERFGGFTHWMPLPNDPEPEDATK